MLQLAGEETVEITAAPGRVWSYRLDFTRLPEYNPDVSDLVCLEEGPPEDGVPGTGSRYRFTLATAHGPHQVELVVEQVVAGREVTASMAGGLSARETFIVDPLPGGRSRATLTLAIDVPDGWPAGTVAGMLDGGRRQIRGELDAIRSVLGNGSVGT